MMSVAQLVPRSRRWGRGGRLPSRSLLVGQGESREVSHEVLAERFVVGERRAFGQRRGRREAPFAEDPRQGRGVRSGALPSSATIGRMSRRTPCSRTPTAITAEPSHPRAVRESPLTPRSNLASRLRRPTPGWPLVGIQVAREALQRLGAAGVLCVAGDPENRRRELARRARVCEGGDGRARPGRGRRRDKRRGSDGAPRRPGVSPSRSVDLSALADHVSMTRPAPMPGGCRAVRDLGHPVEGSSSAKASRTADSIRASSSSGNSAKSRRLPLESRPLFCTTH